MGILLVFSFLFLIQTQIYRIRIIEDVVVEEEIVNVKGQDDAELLFEYNWRDKQTALQKLVKPVVALGAVKPSLVLEDYKENEIEAEYSYESTEEEYMLTVDTSKLKPGQYNAKFTVENDGVYYTRERRFAYGVLAINTTKDSYLVNERVDIQMAALRNDGHTICDADLRLKVISPDQKMTKTKVKTSGKCDEENVIDVPDYFAKYETTEVGVYQLQLRDHRSGFAITSNFEVLKEVPVRIKRKGPTRIYPLEPYAMEITVTTKDGYKGQVSEKVPESFEIIGPGNVIVESPYKVITWDLDLAKSESQTLSYSFDAPDISPEYYLIGPARIGDYQENREWQIASDAPTTVVFATPGTIAWNVPAGVTSLTVESWGGGGGGKGGSYGNAGGGGGGGAYAKKVIAVTPSASWNAVVGSGGTAGAANSGNGGSGGSSYFTANTSGTTANGGTGATTTSGASGGSSNGTADLSYAGATGGSSISSAVSFVSAASSSDGSVTLPTHQAGDLIILMAYRDGANVITSFPTGWTVVESSGLNSNGSAIAYKFATSDSETSGSWGAATEIAVQVFRGAEGIGAWEGNGTVSSTINYPTISMEVTNGSSWVAGFAAHRSASNVEQAPTGMTNQTSAGTEIAAHNTNGGVTSWSSQNVSVNTSSGWRSWSIEIKARSDSKNLTYVGSATGTTSFTMPSHNAGDLLVVFAYRDGNNTAPTVPSGWSVWGAASGGTSNSSVGAYKIAKTNSETSGTWTNANSTAIQIFRGHGGVGGNSSSSGNDTTVIYPALTMSFTNGTSWVTGFAGHRSTDTSLETAPTGMINVATEVDGIDEITGHNTNGTVSSWSDVSVSAGGTNSGWKARTLEIVSPISPVGAGGGGSSAGTASVGTAGNSNSGSTGGGTATAPSGGGNGGGGGNSATAGTAGSVPGGAGGGGGNRAASGNAGGAGANGKVTITYEATAGIDISGTCKQSDQSTNCTDTGTLKVAVNGTLSSSVQNTVAGTWTISNVTQPNTGDIITVFVDGAGESSETVGVTKYDGSGNITGIPLIEERVSIGSDDNQTLTNSNLSSYDNSVSGDEDIFYDVDAGNDYTMTETGKSDAGTYIKTGNTFRPASGGGGDVTTREVDVIGTVTLDTNTFTLTGGGTPLAVSGTINKDTSTFRYTSTLATSIASGTYHHLTLAPSAAGSPTYTLGSSSYDINGNFTVGNGTNIVTVNWDANDPTITVAGNFVVSNNSTWTKSSSATLTMDGATTPVNLTDGNSTKQDLGRLIIDGSKEVDITTSITAEKINVTSGDVLDLQSSGYVLTITGSGTGGSRPFIVDGIDSNLTQGTNSMVSYTGSFDTTIDDEYYNSLTLDHTGTNFDTSGQVYIRNGGVFWIKNGTFSAGTSNVISITSHGDALVVDGTFVAQTSRVHFYSDGSTINIPALDYYLLGIGGAVTGDKTYMTDSGTINIANNLDLGRFYPGTIGYSILDINTNDTTINIQGDLKPYYEWYLQASSNTAAPLTVTGNIIVAGTGTFYHNNGKVILNGASDTTQYISGGALTFYNLEVTGGDRIFNFPVSTTTSVVSGGTLTLTGTDCENMLRVRSGFNATQATLSIDSSATASVSNVDLQDINLTGKTITATNSADSGNNSGNWTVSPSTCLGSSAPSIGLANSFQRKVVYDSQNDNYWSFYDDGDGIEIKYSDDSGSSWQVPTTSANAHLAYDTTDFSVTWKSISTTEYIFFVVNDGGVIKARQAVISADDLVWDTDVSTVLTGTGSYSYPYVALDSSNYIWVGAKYSEASNRNFQTAVSAELGSTDPSTWTWTSYQLSDNSTSENVYGTIEPLTTQDMYATFIVDTTLLGCKWDDSSELWKDSVGDSCITTPGASSEDITTDLEGYWKMNEASWNGTTGEVLDYSAGGSFDGTRVGNATTSSSGFSRSGTFDGTGDYINYGDNFDIVDSTDFTISAWFNRTAYTGDDQIVAKKNSESSSDVGYLLWVDDATDTLEFAASDGTDDFLIHGTTAITATGWHHVVVVFDDSSATGSTIYLDGLEDKSSTEGTITNVNNLSNSVNLVVGSESDAGEPWNGNIDEVRIYDRVLTNREAAYLHKLNIDKVSIDDASDFTNPVSIPNRSIVRSTDGAVYAALNDAGSCEVWKSTDGVNWTELDSSNNPTCDSNAALEVVIEEDNDLQMIYRYFESSEYRIKWVEFDTGTDAFGTPETAYSNIDAGISDYSLTLDLNEKPHVVGYRAYGGTYAVIYLNKVSGSWISLDLEGVPSGADSPTLIINEDDIPEVSYINRGDADLTLVVGDDNNPSTIGEWTFYDVDTSVKAGTGATTMALDPISGNTWVTYSNSNNTVALAKHLDADSWSTWSTVTSKTDVGTNPSIAIDGDQNIYVFYTEDSSDQKIVYDVYDSDDDSPSWQGETELQTPSSGIDYSGVNVKSSTFTDNFSPNRLDYVFSDGTDIYYDYLFLRNDPVKVSDVYSFGTLAEIGQQVVRTSEGQLYSIFNTGRIRAFTSFDNGYSWIEQDVDGGPSDTTASDTVSIAIDSSDIIHIAYESNSDSEDGRYTTFDTSTNTFGSSETAINIGGTGRLISGFDIAVDNNDIPHVIAVEYNGANRVQYSNRIGGSWADIVVLSPGEPIRSTSIAINEDNVPECVAILYVSEDLIAFVGNGNDATSFTFHTVDATVNTNAADELGADIVIDEDGNTWLSYLDENGTDDYVSLAKHTDGSAWTSGWTSEITNSRVGFEPTLATIENIIFLFYRNKVGSLAFDRYDDGNWKGEEILDNNGDISDIKLRWSNFNNNDSSSDPGQAEIDYVYSDGSDAWYNRRILSLSGSAGSTDEIATGLSNSLNSNFTTVRQDISSQPYIHVAYVNSSGNIYYDSYDGDWNFTATQINSNTDNTFLSISSSSTSKNLYLGSIRSSNDDVYSTTATFSAGPSWSWGSPSTLRTDASEIYTNYSANYSGDGKIGSTLSVGDASPYMVDWQTVLDISPNSAPTVTSVSVNGGSDIDLTADSTYSVSWTSTVTDTDGYSDIAGVKGKLYRSGVASAEDCTNNNNNCYEDLTCQVSSCAGNSCTATCTADIYFHAEPTDSGTYSSEYWRGWVEVTDSETDTGEAFSTAGSPDINTLTAISADSEIDFGNIITGNHSLEKSVTITNTGNAQIDALLSGDNMCPDYPTCASTTINVDNQEYSLSTFSYGAGTELSLTPTLLDINLNKSTVSPSSSTDLIYWRLGVPVVQGTGVYSGLNYITGTESI